MNPSHLFDGTQAENVADRDMKGRRPPPQGVANGRAKLTDVAIRAIRVDSRFLRKIAADYGMHMSVISKIKRRAALRR